MASLHPSEIESYATDSVASSPRSDAHHQDNHARVRFMCSFGGKIVPRPHDNQLRYVGGDTRIVAVPRASTYSSLLAKLSKLAGTSNVAVKYQLPSEDLDALISVSTDEDVENMMDEYDRVAQNQNPRTMRLRLFLFPKDDDFNSSLNSAANIATLLQNSGANRDNWFIDALNNNGPPSLERNRSEASSIVSEVPDYLFGLDNNDESQSKLKTRPAFHDAVSVSDPGSPATILPPQFSSIPNLPPVKTRPEQGVSNNIPVLQQYAPPPPPAQAVHHPMPVYYVQGPHHHAHQLASVSMQYMPVQYPYGQPVQGMYGRPAVATVDPCDASPLSLPEHHVMYDVRSAGFPGMVVAASSGGEGIRGSGPDPKTGNFSHS